MRKLTYGEFLVVSEVYPMQVAVKERRKKRHLNNTLYDFRKERQVKNSSVFCGDILCLIQAGIPFERACELLGRLK